MSATAMDIEFACISYQRSRGVGPQAELIQFEETKIEQEAPGSGAKLRAAIAALYSALVDSRVPNWDGHGAAPANMASADYSVRLLKKVLFVAPDIPYVSIDPDGEVALEWRRSPRRVFSVSVGPNGELTYAGLFGRNKVHGVEAQMDEELPREIRAGIRRVYTSR